MDIKKINTNESSFFSKKLPEEKPIEENSTKKKNNKAIILSLSALGTMGIATFTIAKGKRTPLQKALNKINQDSQIKIKEKLLNKMNSHFSFLKQNGVMNSDLDADDLLGSKLINLGKSGQDYDSLVMNKGLNRITIFKDLDEILSNGFDPAKNFHTAPLDIAEELRGIGINSTARHAYTNGPFILVGKKGESIAKTGIETVIVNKSMYPFIKDLKKIYQNQNFIKIEDVNSTLS